MSDPIRRRAWIVERGVAVLQTDGATLWEWAYVDHTTDPNDLADTITDAMHSATRDLSSDTVTRNPVIEWRIRVRVGTMHIE